MTFILATYAFTYAMVIGTLITTAVSAYATYQQGKSNQAIANMNADLANQEAKQQMAIAQLQEQLATRQAEAEHSAAMAEAAASRANAQAIDNESLASEARAREEIRRKRLDAQRILAEQEGGFVAAGVVGTTGTPLAVLAETVATEESNALDQMWMANVESTKKRWEADVERSTAGRIEAVAGAQRAISIQAAKVQGMAGRISARNKMSQASITRMEGNVAMRNAKIGAISTGISGAVSAYTGGLNTYSSLSRKQPATSTPTV